MVDAEHLCMKMRGVRNDAVLSSSAFRGVYESKSAREEIVAHIRRGDRSERLSRL